MRIIINSKAGFRFGTKAGNEWHFDTNRLSESERNTLHQWCRVYPETVVHRAEQKPAPQPAAPSTPPIDTRPDVVVRPAPAVESVDPIAQDFKRDLQRQIDLSQAQERLNFWGRVHGLRDSEKNQRLIMEWLDKNVRGYASGAGVDAAVANLRTVLEWDTPKKVIAPAPAQSDEVLGTLPSGEKQLSITRSPPSNASAAQAKDWLRRYRAANNVRFNAFGR